MKIKSHKVIKNGGFEQGILEIAKKRGSASKGDLIRLEELKKLPQNRIETTKIYNIRGRSKNGTNSR